MQKITLIVHANNRENPIEIDRCVVWGDAVGGNITTGNPGSGQPNTHHYTVTLAGHDLRGAWYDDARRNVVVHIDGDHPLAKSAMLIAKTQAAYRTMHDTVGRKAPIGYRPHEWRYAQDESRRDHAAAEAAMEADETAKAMLPNYSEPIIA